MYIEFDINGIIIILAVAHTLIMEAIKLFEANADNNISISIIAMCFIFMALQNLLITKSEIFPKSERYVEYVMVIKSFVLSFCFLYLFKDYFEFGLEDSWKKVITRFNTIAQLFDVNGYSYIAFSLVISIVCAFITMTIVKTVFRYGYYYYWRISTLSSFNKKQAIKPVIAVLSPILFCITFCPLAFKVELIKLIPQIQIHCVYRLFQYLFFVIFVYTTWSMRKEELQFHFNASHQIYKALCNLQSSEEKTQKPLIKKINRISTTTWMSIYQSFSLIFIAICIGLIHLNKGDFHSVKTGVVPFNMSFLHKNITTRSTNVIINEEQKISFTPEVFIGIIKELHLKGLISNELYTNTADFLCFWVSFSWSLIMLLAILYYRTYRKTRRIRFPKKKFE
jgi:hypothetical protein